MISLGAVEYSVRATNIVEHINLILHYAISSLITVYIDIFLILKNYVPSFDTSIFKLVSTDAARVRSEQLLEHGTGSAAFMFGTVSAEVDGISCVVFGSKTQKNHCFVF